MSGTRSRGCTRGECGIRAGGPRWKRRSRWRAAPWGAPSRRRAPRAACTRPSTCATGAPRSAASTCSTRSRMRAANSRRRSTDSMRSTRRASMRPSSPPTAPPNRSRLGGNACIAVSLAVLHAAAAAHGVPLWRYVAGGAPGHAAAARDPDLRRRRARRAARRRAGFHGDAGRRGDLRRCAGDDRRDLSRRGRADAGGRASSRVSPTRAATGRSSTRTRRRSTG